MATIIGKATRAASRLIIPDNAHLTREPPDIENVRRRTWCGQASWAVGPDYCCDCLHWNGAGGGKYAKSPPLSEISRPNRTSRHARAGVGVRLPLLRNEPRQAARQALRDTF